MASISDFLSPQAINKLGQIAIRSRYVTEGSLSGTHKSPFKGQSMEFADRRRYIQGDNIKDLDWKVFGRTERYYIRQFEEETSLRVSLLLDASASMGYKSGDRMSKYDYACRVAAAIGYVITKQQDSLGLYLYNNTILEKVPARNGTRHFRLILDRLAAHTPKGRTSTGETLHTLAETISRRGLIILFTDCFDDTEAIFHAIAHFRKRMHDVVLLQILDPAELELPMKQASAFYDLETNERIQIDPAHARLAYKKELQAFVDSIRRHCATMNVDYRLVSTAEPFDNFIREYLVERRRMSL